MINGDSLNERHARGNSPRVRVISTELPRSIRSTLGPIERQSVAGHLVAAFIGMKDREQLVAVHLNAQRYIIAIELVATGSLTQALVHPREVFKGAIANNSAAIIVGHNHPSGDLTPSTDDHSVYRELRDAGELLGIPVVDFLIVHGAVWYSLSRN